MKIEYIFRSLFRHRLNSAIIIISLAIGIACMNLIVVFVTREYNVDGFLKNKNRIYALQADDPFHNGEKTYHVSPGAAEYMKANFAEVKDFCRITTVYPKKVIVNHQDYFDQPKVIAVSSNFFEFFSYKLILGKPQNVLKSKQDIVISQNLARKYFGTSNPIGREITLVNRKDRNQMIISGIYKKPLESSNLNFDMVQLIGKKVSSHCYLLLAKNTNIKQLEQKFSRNRKSIPIVYDQKAGTYYLNNLRSTYFDTSRGRNSRDISDLIIALVIALMILGVALFNYLGLTNNRLIEKTKEYAIRRINGSSKTNLVVRFMTETVVLVAIAFALSLLLIAWAIPFFNKLTSSTISISFIFEPKNISLLIGIPVLIILVTCLFALARIGKNTVMEGLQPINFLSVGKLNFPAFHITQLTVSVILIIGAFVISKQIYYISSKKIGMDRHVLEVRIPVQHKNLATVFKSELEKHPSVKVVSIANASPVLEYWMVLLHYDDHGKKKQYTPSLVFGDQNYVKALGIKIIKGKGFSNDPESNKNKCLINQSLAKLFPNRHLIGHGLPGEKKITVIGIVKDFNYESVKHFIEPVYITYGTSGHYLMVKPAPGQMAQVRKIISRTWDKLIPDFPVNMQSIGDRFEWLNRENENYADLIGACCLISMFLSMIGLFAVAFHSSQRRTKEIGIRKVNGASVSEIVVMLIKEFIKWIAIAFVIAVPIAYYFMHRWLENFAYKTPLSWWIFALAGVFVLIIALATVSWQTFTAARKNPVEALRYE